MKTRSLQLLALNVATPLKAVALNVLNVGT